MPEADVQNKKSLWLGLFCQNFLKKRIPL